MKPLAEQPELLIELLAIMVKKAGGTVRFDKDDEIPPFSLRQTLFQNDDGEIWMVLEYVEDQIGTA